MKYTECYLDSMRANEFLNTPTGRLEESILTNLDAIETEITPEMFSDAVYASKFSMPNQQFKNLVRRIACIMPNSGEIIDHMGLRMREDEINNC